VVLDPFMGSGSKGKAALLEGFRFIGMESDTEHGRLMSSPRLMNKRPLNSTPDAVSGLSAAGSDPIHRIKPRPGSTERISDRSPAAA
jgi:hypothetical protein